VLGKISAHLQIRYVVQQSTYINDSWSANHPDGDTDPKGNGWKTKGTSASSALPLLDATPSKVPESASRKCRSCILASNNGMRHGALSKGYTDEVDVIPTDPQSQLSQSSAR
jgi:hypothetical protein